jgi:PadR family transcriptional regulator, regulatory protein PadR
MNKVDWDALILGVLEEGPTHGYEISRRIRMQSEEFLKVPESQLYPALHRLERDGFVESEWDTEGKGPARKVYRMTALGEGKLAQGRKAWQDLVAAVNAVVMPKPVHGGGHG